MPTVVYDTEHCGRVLNSDRFGCRIHRQLAKLATVVRARPARGQRPRGIPHHLERLSRRRPLVPMSEVN
jgi:hypothetical protein